MKSQKNKTTKTTATPTDTKVGPNEKFPFGIKIVKDGNTTWERFKTAKERDGRLPSVNGGIKADYNPSADKPAAPATPDLSKLTTKNLRIALNQEISMKPAVALAYREELAKREGNAPKDGPTAPAADKPKGNPSAFSIHVNKSGRVCFGRDAAARIGVETVHMTLEIDKGIIRMEPTKKPTETSLKIRSASGRPYVSATRQFKLLGFDGTRPYDIAAKPYGNGGFEFRLA